jgi:hypothetical protein
MKLEQERIEPMLAELKSLPQNSHFERQKDASGLKGIMNSGF